MEIVVDSKWVQGFPPLMPRQVEVKLEPQQVVQVRSAAQDGALFVRLDSPEGEKVAVKQMWLNPHDQTRVTCILAD